MIKTRPDDLFRSIPKPDFEIGTRVYVLRECRYPGRKRISRQRQSAVITGLGNRGVNVEIQFMDGTKNRYNVVDIEKDQNNGAAI